MYFEENWNVADRDEQSHSLQDDCLAAFGVELMLSQLSA